MAAAAVAAAVLATAPVAAGRPAPTTWCGSDEVAADRVPELELSSLERIRVVYVIPSDGTDNFLADASGIATDAAWISEWWQEQDPTRTPRFDRYPFPGCAPGFGQLDLGFIRLARAAGDFESSPEVSVSLDAALAGAFGKNQKTIVYYDGPIEDSNECGATDSLSDFGGGNAGIAYVFLDACSMGPPGSGGTAEVAAHELTHNFGAVPDGAPHECPDSPNHVCDDTHDLMYPLLAEGSTLDSVTLDVGHDDYYAHNGPPWDVRDSPWLEHLPQFPVTLATKGSGTLAASASGPVALPCSTGCTSVPIEGGTQLTVAALPKAGWALASWSGACGGTRATCTLTVSAETAATATFARAATRVAVVVAGRGSVTSTPQGVSCPGTCRASFTAGVVRLAAQPGRGWRFTGWSGACRGVGACVARGFTTVRARFTRG